jgi:hypothetical protein
MPEYIECKNCKTSNSPLVIKCAKCGSFIQSRVANLDLPETVWGIIEKPLATFKRICISEQKNYVYLLSAFFGIGLLFFSFWYIRLSNHYYNLFFIILYGIFGGPFLGAVITPVYGIISFLLFKIFLRKKLKFRNILSVSVYSLFPAVLSVLFLLPTYLIMYGLYLFSDNPSPFTIKPMAFYILSILNLIFLLYSFILISIGGMIANNISYFKSLFVSILSVGIISSIVYFTLEYIKKAI